MNEFDDGVYTKGILLFLFENHHTVSTSNKVDDMKIAYWDFEMARKQLNESEQQLIQYFLDGFIASEIATFYGVSNNAISKRKKKVIKKLLEILNGG